MVKRIAELPVFGWHFASVSVPRAERIAAGVGELAPANTRSMLDIGCGDGTLASNVAGRLGSIRVSGVDIKVQPNCSIEVQSYDGLSIPHADGTFDLVTISDVLHHATDPSRVLTEALRVCTPGGAVVLKDHFRLGRWSNSVLLAMDVIGNYAQGIVVTGTYLSPSQWVQLVAAAGGTLDKLVWPFDVHDFPWRLVTRSEYQFLARVRRAV